MQTPILPSRHASRATSLAMSIALALGVFSQASYAGLAQTRGALKVSGNQITDAAGNPIQVTGMSFFWHQWMGKYWTSGAVNTLVDAWKCSLVRAAMGVVDNDNYGNLEYVKDPNGSKAKLKTVVDAAIAKDVYVIIDWHLEGTDPQQAQAVSFFGEMAQTYGKKPNVIFEVFNEPTSNSWSSVKSYAEAVLAEIRKSSQNLVIVGTPDWSKDVKSAAADPITKFDNVAYTFHFYAGSHGAEWRKKVDSARAKGIAVFLTEWGTSLSSGDGGVFTKESDEWLSWAQQNNLSWANWSLNDKAETSAALNPNAPTDGNWNDGQISTSGKYIRGKIQESYTRMMGVRSRSGVPMALSVRSSGNGIAFDVPAGATEAILASPSGRELSRQDLRGLSHAEMVIPGRGLAVLRVGGEGWSRSHPVFAP